jgi:isopenicillin-N N-acyltransferase-like protein
MNRCFLYCTLLLPITSLACTLWGAAGPDAGGGTLISKNRDWKPDHHQLLKQVRPVNGFAYFGLYAEGNATPGLKAGVNEKGLSIVSASSNISKKLQDAQRDRRGVMVRVLSEHASVDDVLRHADALFSLSRANFFMIADRHQLLIVEVGLDGRYGVKVVDQGATAHTNHYLDPALAGRFGDAPRPSSAARLARIGTLLDEAPRPLATDSFVAMSRDHNDGPDNSLWRNGREHTLASWIVNTPADGAPRLRVTVANPGEAENTQEIVLDDAFWQCGPEKDANPVFDCQSATIR